MKDTPVDAKTWVTCALVLVNTNVIHTILTYGTLRFTQLVLSKSFNIFVHIDQHLFEYTSK